MNIYDCENDTSEYSAHCALTILIAIFCGF